MRQISISITLIFLVLCIVAGAWMVSKDIKFTKRKRTSYGEYRTGEKAGDEPSWVKELLRHKR